MTSTPGDAVVDHSFMIGAWVFLHGLKDVELNGAAGEVDSWYVSSGRLGISLREGGRKAIRI